MLAMQNKTLSVKKKKSTSASISSSGVGVGLVRDVVVHNADD